MKKKTKENGFDLKIPEVTLRQIQSNPYRQYSLVTNPNTRIAFEKIATISYPELRQLLLALICNQNITSLSCQEFEADHYTLRGKYKNAPFAIEYDLCKSLELAFNTSKEDLKYELIPTLMPIFGRPIEGHDLVSDMKERRYLIWANPYYASTVLEKILNTPNYRMIAKNALFGDLIPLNGKSPRMEALSSLVSEKEKIRRFGWIKTDPLLE